MATYKFTTPTTPETPMGEGALFSRYEIDRGISVLRKNGTYSSYRYPSLEEVLNAEEVYLGGRIHIIDEATKDRLTAAGYGDYIVEE